jgi:Spherulation-specific family 4
VRHLIRTRRRPAQALAVPAYFHPAVSPLGWEELTELGSHARFVVVNVADGPGERPDSSYVEVVDRLLDAGVVVTGYVTSGYGSRSVNDLAAEAERYRDWYGIRGVFVDQVASHAGAGSHYRALVTRLRAHGAAPVVLNPGVWPDEALRDLADVLVTFEGTWETYRDTQFPSADSMDPHTNCHLVYATPSNDFATVRRLASDRRAGVLYVTSSHGDNPWGRLSAFVHEWAVRP